MLTDFFIENMYYLGQKFVFSTETANYIPIILGLNVFCLLKMHFEFKSKYYVAVIDATSL